MFLIDILEFRLASWFALIEANIQFRACKQNIGMIEMGGYEGTWLGGWI